ncbi:hypothetical protein EDD21DRAFT_406494 [Dissophora ornata]|nr:hypothetical protein EDD21DRAFT_406494 [Dissophora ornata]
MIFSPVELLNPLSSTSLPPSLISENPLNIPELRALIAQYTPVHDAIACAQVCKDWTDDFTARVWSNIDFEVHFGHRKLDPQAIRKYGHLIRVIKNLENGNDLDLLQCSTVSNLQTLKLNMEPNSRFQARCCDMIRRNNSSLTHIDLSVVQEMDDTELFFFGGSVCDLLADNTQDQRLRLDSRYLLILPTVLSGP